MKKYSLVLAAIFLAGCTQIKPEADSEKKTMTGVPCQKMGETYMGDCVFDDAGNVIQNESESDIVKNELGIFSTDIDDLETAKKSEIVELNDGDTYKMVASIVKQEMGNRTIKRLAYNGQIPGPLLKVPKDAEITIEFKNELDVETTLHSHGLRLENKFDGVPGVTQEPIKPGESFTYKLMFPDEGIYWYHPHIREDYTQELGLYGNFLVEPGSEDYWNEVDRESFLIFDDILINEDQPAFPKEHVDHALMGRFGNIMLINNDENFKMSAKKNEVIRFYLTNVANTRTFKLSMPGAKLKLVGGDVGRIENEAFVDDILIAPAERYIVEALFENEGEIKIQHTTPDKTYTLGTIQVEGELESTAADFTKLRSNKSDYETIRSEIDKYISRDPDKKITLSISMSGMNMGAMERDEDMDMEEEERDEDMDMEEEGMMKMEREEDMDMEEDMEEEKEHDAPKIEWEDDSAAMNVNSTSENILWQIIDQDTEKVNMDIDWQFKVGELVKVRIFNDPDSVHPMQHPIHFHGQQFLVLSRDGKVNDNFQWKDTTLVKNGETVDILLEVTNPGKWMVHCHIAEHLHSGMMMQFNVN